MALTKGRVLVEYVGEANGPLRLSGIKGKTPSTLGFEPKEIYNDRRVEEFPSEGEAVTWMDKFNRNHREDPIFVFATDMIGGDDRAVIEELVTRQIDPIRAEVAEIRQIIEAARKKATRGPGRPPKNAEPKG